MCNSVSNYPNFILNQLLLFETFKQSPLIIQVGTADVSRIASRTGAHFTKALLFLMVMLPGSPVIYYGDEIGMVDGVKMNTSSNDPATILVR